MSSFPLPNSLRRSRIGAVIAAFLAIGSVGAQPQPGSAGAARTVIVLDSVDLTAVSTLSELLQARVPGLLVQSGSGTVGAGARVSARGLRSVLGFADPLLVIDGVRAVGTERSLGLDDLVTVSRLDDVVLEQVETVEVLRGPAAAVRYGPGAANGAIVVTTRAGRAGAPRKRAYAHAGAVSDVADYPLFYVGLGRAPGGESVRGCTLAMQVGGTCQLVGREVQDRFAEAPARTGRAGGAGASLAGAGGWGSWFAAADLRSAQGAIDGNDASRAGARTNVELHPAAGLSLRIGASALRRDVSLRPGDYATFVNRGRTEAGPMFTASPPGSQAATRGDGSVALAWTPSPAVRAWVQGGVSDVARDEHLTDVSRTAGTEYRWVTQGSGHDWTASGEAGTSLDYGAGPLRLATEVALERSGARHTASLARGSSPASDPGPTWYAWSWNRTALDLHAVRLAQRARIGERLTADAMVRANRVRGQHADAGLLGSDVAASAAWVALGSPSGGSRALRLRAAYGASTLPFSAFVGARPSPVCLECVATGAGRDRPAMERTREVEGGVDVELARGAGVRLTAFRQRVSDVLMEALAPPSLGVNGAVVLKTMGAENDGMELDASAPLIERSGLGLSLGARAALVRNRLRSPGPTVPVTSASSTDRRFQDGEPIGAYGLRPMRYDDANGDGIIAPGEVWVDPTGQSTYAGPAAPTRLLSADVRLRLGRRTVVTAVAEHRGGYLVYGGRTALLHRADLAALDPAQPAEHQAWAAVSDASGYGLLQRGDFTRLRELSVAWSLGRGAGAPTLALAGRNLLTLTGFDGPDPETNGWANEPLGAGGFYTQPLPATLTVRLTRAW